MDASAKGLASPAMSTLCDKCGCRHHCDICPDCEEYAQERAEREAQQLVPRTRERLLTMTNEERLSFFKAITDGFCVHCGCVQPPRRSCKCWNDE